MLFTLFYCNSEPKQDSGAPGRGSLSVSSISCLWEIGFSLHDLHSVPKGRFKQLLIREGWGAETRGEQSRNTNAEFPGCSGGYNFLLSLPRAWVQSLAEKLRSYTWCSAAKKEKSNHSVALGQDPGSISKNTHNNIFELFCKTKMSNKWKMLIAWWFSLCLSADYLPSEFLKTWEYQTTWPAFWEICM